MAGALTALAAFLCLNCPAAAGTDQASPYVRKATWHETLIASREAMVRTERSAGIEGRPLHEVSPVVRGGEPARRMSVDVEGLSELYLYVTGAPEVIYGAATWADPVLIFADGKKTLACHAPGLRVMAGRHEIDRNLFSGVSGPLKIAGQRFDHGIHVYAPSKVRVPLPEGCRRFECWIGIDDWVGPHGAVRFHVVNPRGAARLDLWTRLQLDFHQGKPREQIKWVREDRIFEADWEPGDYGELARRLARACSRVPRLAQMARQQAAHMRDAQGWQAFWPLYYPRVREIDQAISEAPHLNFTGLRLAIEDLRARFGPKYPGADGWLSQLEGLQEELDRALTEALHESAADGARVVELVAAFKQLQREALLANPLLDFDRLLVIRRVPHGDPRRPHGRGYGVGEYIGLPRQSSKCNPNIEQPFAWDNEIAVLSPLRPDGELQTLYKPDGGRLITDLDLNWDGKRLLFSMPGTHNKWHVFEIHGDGTGLRQLTPTDLPDVHFYDACYLPDGRIAMVSTAPMQGVPCNAGVIVGMMYTMDGDGRNIRQVCFEQDHTYCPTVLHDGRILYLRWDYTDTPHVWNRMLFTLHPDGTQQREFYGANSYWPNSIFFARPVPGHPTKVVGIVTGHHVGRVGELVVFDPARGRHETQGVVQRIAGCAEKVAPLIEDKLTEHSWPKFVHPYPLSENYFLVACKPRPDALWGIYLADVFDNLVLLSEEEGHALLEPIPLRSSPPPPVIVDRRESFGRDARVYMADVYAGGGLRGVPRGAVKSLRVFTYHFGYQKLAGIDHRVGTDGPWEVKRVLGTVPVEPDGSAFFRIPADTPLSVQPLDEEGKALQLMRSWMTAMPGETISCVGCHEHRNSAPPAAYTMAAHRGPSQIEPWHGPVRGFSFLREVQPVLDRYCVGCHDGSPRADGRPIPDLRHTGQTWYAYRHGDPALKRYDNTPLEALRGKYRGIFPPAYIALRRLVRVGGLESDLHLLPLGEFHADTTELVQMLRKGHHGVKLDAETWDRLITWIDLNAPCHGTWSEFTPIAGPQAQRRQELRKRYGGPLVNGEEIPELPRTPVEPVMPEPEPDPQPAPVCAGWPLSPEQAAQRQAALGTVVRRLDLGEGVSLELVRIPAGKFVMGNSAGTPDERPAHVVGIERPFWIGRCEVTNRQYARFDPAHDSRFEHRTSWIFSEQYLGWALHGPDQPVVRVSWRQATAFCDWLSDRTGLRITLPSEAQWEYAARAGSDQAFWYGDLDADFSPFANLADHTMRELADEAWRPRPPDLVPRDDRFNDRALVTADVGRYAANPWALHDVHGNVWEWTRSMYRPYPYRDEDGRNDRNSAGRRVVRGGSWYDRPKRCTASMRWGYQPYQRVYNVGFRVVCEEPADGSIARAAE